MKCIPALHRAGLRARARDRIADPAVSEFFRSAPATDRRGAIERLRGPLKIAEDSYVIEGHDYTIYSNGPTGRSRMYAFLALITAFLTPIVQHGCLVLLQRYWKEDWDGTQAALFFGGFTALILFGVLINVFDSYLWRMRVGAWMFRVIGLSVPPDLNGEYHGTIEVRSATEGGSVFRTEYSMRIAQTWEQLSLLLHREAESGGLVRLHSDLASIRVGMMEGVTTLRFVYTFEENLPRREGGGSMARKFSGAATFEFHREGGAWQVAGHFFDDIGRSGEIGLQQDRPAPGHTTTAQALPATASEQPQASPGAGK
jgi:hypothetical protein